VNYDLMKRVPADEIWFDKKSLELNIQVDGVDYGVNVASIDLALEKL